MSFAQVRATAVEAKDFISEKAGKAGKFIADGAKAAKSIAGQEFSKVNQYGFFNYLGRKVDILTGKIPNKTATKIPA